jgi:DNA-directed RNA polymerase subunit M/transcription elongation factor TFIIS
MPYISPFHHTKYGFITEQAKELADDFIMDGEKAVKRAKYQIELSNILDDIDKAIQIETSIFEFALTYCLTNDYTSDNIYSIYCDKFYNIKQNLVDERINNKSFRKNIIGNKIDLKQIAFFTPAQLHPEKWQCFIEKQKCIKERENNIKYSDAYKCYKCGESKSKISLVQTRSADEPMTMFITCLVCGDVKKS